MLDCSTRLTVVAFLGALVALPTTSDAGSKVSRAVLTSKGAVSQPFGNRSSPAVQERHSPRIVDRNADRDRDRYSGRDHDQDHDRYHDNDHRHDRDRYHGHRDCDDDHNDYHHYDYRYSRYYYPPSIFFGFGFPSFYPSAVGYGPVGYWCERCHFHTTAVAIFYDHVHLAHQVNVAVIPSLLVWNPASFSFVFD